MIDLIASIQHQNLVLSRNPVVINVDAVILAVGQPRTNLRYRAKIFVQRGYQNNQFEQIGEQEASELPITGSNTISAGAYFLLNNRLDDSLSPLPPILSSTQVTVCPNLTRQYYVRYARYNGITLIDETNLPTAWIYRGGISDHDYDNYRDMFFTEHIGKGRRFLTWQPTTKIVSPDQPEFLYFLTNFSPTPTQLNLRVRCLYQDGTSELFTALNMSNVAVMSVYCFPVSVAALDLATRPKKVVSYTVWVSNQINEQLSETREFQIDYVAYQNCKYLLFLNGLGTYDTLRCVGAVAEREKVARQIVERFAGYDYLPTSSDEYINDVTGERTLEVSTGNWLSERYRAYLEDMLLSAEFYVAERGHFVPLIPTFDSLTTQNKVEWPIERNFSFRYANARKQFSSLPAFAKPTRPVAWRPYVTSCEINGNGIRTGRRVVNELVLYYTDTLNLVRPLVTTTNVPGVQGYTAPQSDPNCAATTTPFLSDQIQRLGAFTKQNCATNMTGLAATITIAAATFGSEFSKADANAKAEVAFSAIDKQDYANTNGTCTNVLPQDYTVTVPAGHYYYRANLPSSISISSSVPPVQGNGWWVPDSSAPYKFPQDSHNFAMPLQDAELTIAGAQGSQFNIKIYRNGVLMYDKNLVINQEYYAKAWLFNTGDNVFPDFSKYAPGSGDKMYIQLTWL